MKLQSVFHLYLMAVLTCCWSPLSFAMQDASGQSNHSNAEVTRTQKSSGGKTDSNKQWAQWRGPAGTGVAPHAKPPTRWSENENVKWKSKIPGLGHSSPIVWNDQIFVTTAVPVGPKFAPIRDNVPGSHDNLPVSQQHKFLLISYDRETGAPKWTVELNRTVPKEGAHRTGSLASASPVTDGTLVYVSLGSYGIYAVDIASQKIAWSHELGYRPSKHGHGEGASPALYNDTLILNWDNEGQSIIVAYDKRTGQEQWKVKRSEVTSWASPIVVQAKTGPQVIVAGSDRIRAYQLANGNVVWSCGGMSQNIVATPVANERMVFVGSSYEKRAMFGIEFFDAAGDITGTAKVKWARNQRTPYVPSPLLYDNELYFLRHYQGILTQVTAPTGEEQQGPFRLRGFNDIYASPVAADGKIFIVDRSGATLVLSHKEMPRVLGINRLDDSFSATPALVDNQFILRGERFLYLIENQETRAPN